MLATGIFAVATVGGASGLIDGNADQIGRQLAAIGATAAYSLVVTFAILKVLGWVMGLRVSEEEELVGVDVSQHGERAYAEAFTLSLEPLVVPGPSPAPVSDPFVRRSLREEGTPYNPSRQVVPERSSRS